MAHHRYRTAVAGGGILYDGQSRTEAYRQFDLFVAQSKDERSATAAQGVAVFMGYDIVREYVPKGHWHIGLSRRRPRPPPSEPFGDGEAD